MITFSQITTFTWKKGIDLSTIITNLGKDIHLKIQYRRHIQEKFDEVIHIILCHFDMDITHIFYFCRLFDI